MLKQSVIHATILKGAIGLSLMCAANAFADQPTYNNMFISYYSPANVSAMANYVVKYQKLGGMILWELRGDATYNTPQSLLSALDKGIAGYEPTSGKPPLVMGYWDDWGLYSNDPSSRAIPESAYPMPGSLDQSGDPVAANQTKDLTDKFAGVNVVAYAFLEAQTKTYSYYDNTTKSEVTIPNKTPQDIGTLFVNDAWADLMVPGKSDMQDKFCGTTATANPNSKICWFSLNNRNTPITPASGAMMGNLTAFTAIKHASDTNPLGSLKKVISVGGYAHDATFEEAFTSSTTMSNFVNSAKAIIDGFNLDGIDLDYENPAMTHQQSEDYLTLIQQLRAAMPNKLITVTMLAGPDYINGVSSGSAGFANGVLPQIAKFANHINLMTYDFHGSFDYTPDGKGTTGFLSNLYHPNDAPSTYKFSIDESVKAMINQGVSSDKITVGIPAYGRSLDNVNASNGGLFQPLTSSVTIPRGDLDLKNCNTAVTSSGPATCGGVFSYQYIIKNMLTNGFTATDHTDDASSISNGTTAFATTWTPPAPAGYSLEISNAASSAIAFNVTVGSFNAPDFFTANKDVTYSATKTNDITNQTGLSVNWTTTWGPKGTCPNTLDFTHNSKVTITVTATGPGQYNTECSIS